jgi:protocatechuate 3,4-dioxygenase beta subunit
MSPRTTAFGLLALLVVVCGAGILLVRNLVRPDIEPEVRPGPSERRAEDPAGVVAPPAKLSGRVLTPEGRPVPGARVVARPLDAGSLSRYRRSLWIAGAVAGETSSFPGETTTAGEDGGYAFDPLAGGRYALRAFADGKACRLEVVSLGGGSPVRQDLVLVPDRAISGRVIDAATGLAADGAVVLVSRIPAGGLARGDTGLAFLQGTRGSAVVDASGEFRIGGLLGGRHEVLAVKPGYARAAAFALADGEAVELSLVPGGAIVGTVTDESGAPLAGAELRVWRADQTPEGEGHSVEDGTYRVDGLVAGKKWIVARAPGRVPLRRAGLEVRVGAETRVDLTLAAGRVIAGRVVDGEGRPLVGASVTAHPRQAMAPEPVLTDGIGGFRVSGLPEGKTLLRAELAGYGRGETSADTGDEDAEIVLLRAGTLRVRATSETTGGPLVTYWVRVFRKDADATASLRNRILAPRQRVRAAEDGSHRVEGLTPGTYGVEVVAEGHGPATSEDIEVPAGGESKVVELALGAEAAVTGRVLLAVDETPVAGARVSVNIVAFGRMPVARTQQEVRTGPDGRFRIGSLPAGETSITVSHPDHPGVVATGKAVPADGPAEEILVRLVRGGGVRGTVYGERGRTLPAERVVVQGVGAPSFLARMVDTDSQGRFSVERVPPGPVTVLWFVDLAARDFRAKQVVVRDGAWEEVDFHAFGEGAEVTLTVRDAKGPVEDATAMLLPVTTTSGREPALRTGATDAEGKLLLKGLPAGRYVVQVTRAALGAQKSVPLTLGPGERTSLVMKLHAGSIAGVVKGPDGKPVAEAIVLALPAGGLDRSTRERLALGIAGQAVSGPDGTFRVEGLAVGSFRLHAEHGAFGTGSLEGVAVREGEATADVELRLPRAAALRLRVSGPDGPVNAVFLRITTAEGRPVTLLGRMLRGEDGRIEVPSVPAGTYRMVVGGEGFAPTVVPEAAVPADGATEVAVRLTRGGNVRVRVVDRDGLPIAGVTPRWDGPGLLATASILAPPSTTDAEGTVLLEHVATGPQEIVVEISDVQHRATAAVREGETVDLRLVADR